MTRWIFNIFILLVVVMAGGCFNTEKEYEQLVAENKTLATELQTVENENEILNRALDNINTEQESLQNLLSMSRGIVSNRQNQASLPAPVVGVEDDYWVEASAVAESVDNTGSGEIYVVVAGDVLSNIALQYNTTSSRLVELNPYLDNRNNYMLRVNDRIRLP